MDQVPRRVAHSPAAIDRLQRKPSPPRAFHHGVQRVRIGQAHLIPPQAGRVIGRWGRAHPGPCVDAEVMVIAARGQKAGRLAITHHEIEAQHIAIKVFRRRDVSDVQMDVAHGCAWRKAIPRRLVAVQFLEHAFELEWVHRHAQRSAGEFPLGARAVAIDFDAVAVGVAEIERLAHGVVAGAPQRRAGVDEMAQRARQLLARGDEQRKVIEAGAATLYGSCAGLFMQDQQVAATRAERGLAVIAPVQLQTNVLLIIIKRSSKVGDDERHRADGGVGVDGCGHGKPYPSWCCYRTKVTGPYLISLASNFL